MIVYTLSSGFEGENEAIISVDNNPIIVKPNDSGNYRGLHLVLVDPKTYSMVFAKVFDTYKSSDDLEKFIS